MKTSRLLVLATLLIAQAACIRVNQPKNGNNGNDTPIDDGQADPGTSVSGPVNIHRKLPTIPPQGIPEPKPQIKPGSTRVLPKPPVNIDAQPEPTNGLKYPGNIKPTTTRVITPPPVAIDPQPEVKGINGKVVHPYGNDVQPTAPQTPVLKPAGGVTIKPKATSNTPKEDTEPSKAEKVKSSKKNKAGKDSDEN